MLGGTEFVGAHLVAALLEAGHEVTLANRGRTNPDAFPQASRVIVDRDEPADALRGTRWDVVYDVSAYEPAHVVHTADALGPDVRYVFVSTISVYADMSHGPITEASAVFQTPLEEVDRDSPAAAYGPLKALAEDVVRARFPHHVIVRPTVLGGPMDPTDRLTYWVTRLAVPGPHLAPDPLDVPVQVLDARDLADWLTMLAGRELEGTFNAAPPSGSLRDLLEEILACTGAEVTLTAATEDRLAEHGVQAWADMPLWLPPSEPSIQAQFEVDASRAAAAGLRIRPVAETVQAVLDWADHERLLCEPRRGLTAQREAEVLRALAH